MSVNFTNTKYNNFIKIIFVLINYILICTSQLQSKNNDYSKLKIFDHCNNNEYYNDVLLSCISCNSTYQKVNNDKSGCICNNGYKQISSNDLLSQLVGCQKCNSNNDSMLAVSYNNLECVHCYSKNNTLQNPDTNTRKCPICENGYMPYLDKNSNPMKELCIPCTIDSENIFNTCKNCRYGICYNMILNETINLEEASLVNSITSLNQKFVNKYIMNNILEATYFCKKGIRKECNHLANMCILQNYEIYDSNNACNRLQNIIRENIYTWNQYVPSIFNQNSDRTIQLNSKNTFDKIYNSSTINPFGNKLMSSEEFKILANIYTINGTFIGHQFIQYIDIQLCTGLYDNINGFLKLGKQYKYKCLLTSNDFFLKKANLFYELYFYWFSNDNQKIYLYPIFIINHSITSNSKIKNYDGYINDDWILTRRFYTYENTLQINQSTNILFRYMNSFKLIVTIPKEKNKKNWLLYALITYEEVKKNNNNKFEHTFSVLFTENEPDDEASIDILLAIICTISILWAAVKAYSWSKRSGKMIADINTIIQLILCECDNISNIFIIVIGISSVWCTFAYKAQKVIVFILPINENILHFKNYIIIALILKFIAIIKRYCELILADTFFIDWEKPKGEINKNNSTNNNKIKEDNLTNIKITTINNNNNKENNINNKLSSKNVGIWRTYFVANEWNELQNYRKIHIGIHLFTIIIIFEVLNFKSFSIFEPGFNFSNELFKVNYFSSFFRFGIISVIYFGMLLIQWTIRVFILEPIIDPFHNFIDLCSIANISVLSLTHSLHGYYIHGQSPHGYADTNMQEINKFLQLEKNNQCGFRGLENGSDLQTYIITMPKIFREKFLKIQGILRQSNEIQTKMRNSRTITENIEYRSKVYDELNIFLRNIIEHDDEECDYDITTMKVMEDITDMEFADTTNRGIFYKDTSEVAFTQSFIYGNEWVLCTFEFCLLQCIDIIFNNLLIAAFSTYIISQIIKKIASIFFTSHLIKSSLIDHRFLI
uniref:Meckelin n=1 Tax=Strongyloides stercoralis TaxID=6248 RepID=A0A0K0ESR4_STRER